MGGAVRFVRDLAFDHAPGTQWGSARIPCGLETSATWTLASALLCSRGSGLFHRRIKMLVQLE